MEILIEYIMQAFGRCYLKNVALLKLCRGSISVLIFHTTVTCFHGRIFTDFYCMLKKATGKKE